MGKSPLLLRIIDRAAKIGYETVKVDFQQTDTTILANCDRLSRWFCNNVVRQLNLAPNLDELEYACNWVRNYFHTNADIQTSDRLRGSEQSSVRYLCD